MSTLYTLTNKVLMLQEYIEKAENPEELAELIADSKEALELSIDDKLEGMMTIRQNKLARVNALKEESARLAELAKKEQKEVERIEKYAQDQLSTLGHSHKEKSKKIVGNFEMKFKKLPPKLEIVDAKKVPAKYMSIPKPKPAEPDKKALLDLMKEKAKFLHGDKWTKEIDELALEDFGIKLENNNQKFEIL
jgi:hypothetical protein